MAPVRGWSLQWSGWREPANQYVRVGFWVATPLDKHDPHHDCVVSTTLGFVGPMPEGAMIDLYRYDRQAPILPSESAQRFAAAKAQARQNLVTTLESL